MPQVRLTDLVIRNIKRPDTGQTTYTDENLKGFGVRVSQGGAKTFVLVHGQHRSRTTIGRYPVVSLSQARARAKSILAERTLHPRSGPTLSFEEALTLYLTVHCEPRQRPRTFRETKRHLDTHFLPPLRGLSCHDISARDVTPALDKLLNRPSECNHAFVAIRGFFRWAVARQYVPHDPIGGLSKPAKTVSRDRFLADSELRRVLDTAPSQGTYGEIVELLVLTGQRSGQITHLRGEYIDPDAKTITWPPGRMKSDREHTIPYGDRASELISKRLKDGYLFHARYDSSKAYNTFSKPKGTFDEVCPIPHWTLHDLRRTFATGHAKIGAPPHVVERLLAHSTGTISGVAAIYNRHTYMDEMRIAMATWEKHLARLLAS